MRTIAFLAFSEHIKKLSNIQIRRNFDKQNIERLLNSEPIFSKKQPDTTLFDRHAIVFLLNKITLLNYCCLARKFSWVCFGKSL